jgi:tRNA(Ile)-lysidine synthase
VDAALGAAIQALHAGELPAGTTVLVGVSGGQDSLCLVHALWRLQPEHGWALHVLTVDHGIRPEAAVEADTVAATCAAWGLPASVLRLDVPVYSRRYRLNVQAAARYARYQAFAREGAAVGAPAVLVAHTADDVAETLLLHLLRGAGLDGLAAMSLVQALPLTAWGPPIGDGPEPSSLCVVRPLLPVARADTAAYCAEHGLSPAAEERAHYRRDDIRHALLPFLERYNPAVRRVLAGAASALAEDRAALDAWTGSLIARFRQGDEAFAIPLAEWGDQPVAIRKRVLRGAACALAGPTAQLGARHLAAALRLAADQAGRGIDLPGGLRLEREPDRLVLARRGHRGARPAGPWLLPIPGSVIIPGMGVLRAARCPAPPASLTAASASECWLDAAAAGGMLTVRWRQPGDRFQPLGMAREKRLQDFLVDARVPRAARDRLPLVLAGERIAWVVGQRIADWARVRPGSAAVLHLVFEPDSTYTESWCGYGRSLESDPQGKHGDAD